MKRSLLYHRPEPLDSTALPLCRRLGESVAVGRRDGFDGAEFVTVEAWRQKAPTERVEETTRLERDTDANERTGANERTETTPIEPANARAEATNEQGMEARRDCRSEVRGEDRVGPRAGQPPADLDVDRPVNAVAVSGIPAVLGQALERLHKLLEEAAAVAARCLNLTLPAAGESSGAEGFHSYQDALNLAYELLHGLRHQAERTGVALALEAATNGNLLSPVELRELIRAANSWAVGACIDVDRVARIGRPADWITTLRGSLHAVRVDVGGAMDRSPRPQPGEPAIRRDGVVDRAELLDALDEVYYDRIVIVRGGGEPASVRSAAAWLHTSAEA